MMTSLPRSPITEAGMLSCGGMGGSAGWQGCVGLGGLRGCGDNNRPGHASRVGLPGCLGCMPKNNTIHACGPPPPHTHPVEATRPAHLLPQRVAARRQLHAGGHVDEAGRAGAARPAGGGHCSRGWRGVAGAGGGRVRLKEGRRACPHARTSISGGGRLNTLLLKHSHPPEMYPITKSWFASAAACTAAV